MELAENPGPGPHLGVDKIVINGDNPPFTR